MRFTIFQDGHGSDNGLEMSSDELRLAKQIGSEYDRGIIRIIRGWNGQ